MTDMKKLQDHLIAQFGEGIAKHVQAQDLSKPWLTEPAKLEWLHEPTGLRCMILRHQSMQHLCGYVKLPDGWTDIGESFNVHGGVTFTGELQPEAEGYWIGFDCAHSGDLTPFMLGLGPCSGTYRTIDYVKSECENLATGIKEEMDLRGREAVRIGKHVTEFGPDSTLTAEQLDDRYNQDGDGEHPAYKVSDWSNAVGACVTRQGYWDWVVGVLKHEADMAKTANGGDNG